MEASTPRPRDPRPLVRHWIHSHEDDSGDTELYRPDGYGFPLSRGRGGFELRADGTVRYDLIGQGDRPEAAEGSWRLDGQGDIHLDFESLPPVVLEVVSHSNDELRLRRRAVGG